MKLGKSFMNYGNDLDECLGKFTPSYILHTRAFGTYLIGGLFTLQKKI